MSQAELQQARSTFEQHWRETRERLSGEFGVELRRSGWLILLLAGAVGVASAVAIKAAKGKRGAELPPHSD